MPSSSFVFLDTKTHTQNKKKRMTKKHCRNLQDEEKAECVANGKGCRLWESMKQAAAETKKKKKTETCVSVLLHNLYDILISKLVVFSATLRVVLDRCSPHYSTEKKNIEKQ